MKRKQTVKENMFIQSLLILDLYTWRKKKYVALVSGRLTLTLQSVPGGKFFVSKRIYDNRLMNFLKNSTLVVERDVRLICGLDLDEKSTFEFKFKPGRLYLTAWDYILPAITGKGTSLTFISCFLQRSTVTI